VNLGVRRVTQRKFHTTEGPQMLDATASWRLAFVHIWFKFVITHSWSVGPNMYRQQPRGLLAFSKVLLTLAHSL